MRKSLIAAVSAAALMAGGSAFAMNSPADDQPVSSLQLAQTGTGTGTGGTTGGAGTGADTGAAEDPDPATGTETTPGTTGTGTTTGTETGGGTTTTTDTPTTTETAPTTGTGAATTGTATTGMGGDTLTAAQIESIEGATVMSSDGEELGTVSEVVEGTGGMQQVIVASGGFLGIGETEIAVDASQVDYNETDEVVTLSVTREQFEAMPSYEGN